MTESERRIRSELIRALHARPFRPFTIRRKDDRRYPISHPEVALMTSYGWSCMVAVPGRDTLDLLPLRILAAIEYPPPRMRTHDVPAS